MKIYRFDPETGVYLGEDFSDGDGITMGVREFPADATTLAPPRIGENELPVFDCRTNCWEVRPAPSRQSPRTGGKLAGEPPPKESV